MTSAGGRSFAGVLAATVIACLLAMLGWACSDSANDASSAMNDAGPDTDVADVVVDTRPACSAPTAAPDWLDAYLAERMAKLTGKTEIAPGVTITDRATPEHRGTARDFLRTELASLGYETSVHEYAAGANVGANVIGRLAPIDGDAGLDGGTEWIVVGAHYDGVLGSPGANDNASGVTAVLAIARMLAAQPCRQRGIIVAMFDQEEIGLVGSTAFARELFVTGTPIHAAHTVDQVAWDKDGDLRFELELPTNDLLAEYTDSAALLGLQVVKTNVDASDHQSFRAFRFPAVGITEEYVNKDTTPFAHDAGDTADTVAPPYHAAAVRLVAHVVARELGAD